AVVAPPARLSRGAVVTSRPTLILLAIAAICAAVVLLWERKLPGTDARREQQGRLFPAADAETIDRVVLEQAEQRVELMREDEGWLLTAPLSDRADAWRVDELVRTVLEAKANTMIPADQVKGGDDVTGLGQTALRAVLEAGTQHELPSRRYELEIGRTPAPGGVRYARVGGADALAIVDEALAASIEQPVEQLRDRNLFRLAAVDIARLSLERADGARFVLERRANERWWLSPGAADGKSSGLVEDEADQSEVAALVSELVRLRAEDFADEAELAEHRLEPAPWRLELHPRADEDAREPAGERENSAPTLDAVIVEIGAAVPGAEALHVVRVSDRASPFEVRVSTLLDQLRSLGDDPHAWRSRRVFAFSSFEVRELELERGPERVTLQRATAEDETERAWSPRHPEDFPLDAGKLDTWLSNVSRLEALRLLEAPAHETQAAPRAHVTFHVAGDDHSVPETLEILGCEADECLARRSGRSAVLVLSRESAELIDPQQLREAASDEGGEEP
ncbi:MAG: DUF4340 domain-containing protein, partial [Acidobacteriota bacterium]